MFKGGGEMKVQKVVVEEKSYPLYILLDKNFEVVEPVKRYIKYLDNTGKCRLPVIAGPCPLYSHRLYFGMKCMGLVTNSRSSL